MNECFNGTLSGLLTADTYQPRAVWWLHKSYADGVRGRVQAVASSPQLVVLASNSMTGGNSGQILVGNWSFQATVSQTPSPSSVKLSLTNLQSVGTIGQATSIGIQLELIPTTDIAPLSQPRLIRRTNVPITGGAAELTLPPLQAGEVFRVTFTPVVHTRLHTLTPCRVLDTRNATGALGGPALAPGAARSFPVTASACGIPGWADSISINATITQPTAGGFLTLYPGNGATPLASSMNFGAGQTRANNAILRLATDGSGTIAVANGAPGIVHFILDVNGYFE